MSENMSPNPSLDSKNTWESSEQVNERHQKAVNDTVHLQMWNLLTEKTPPAMQQKRYLPSNLFVTRTVSCIFRKTVLLFS
jgi:hypothetical protein